MSYSHETTRPNRIGLYMPSRSSLKHSYSNDKSVYETSREANRGPSVYQLPNSSAEDDIQFSDSISARPSASPALSITSEDLSIEYEYVSPRSGLSASQIIRGSKPRRWSGNRSREWSPGEDTYEEATPYSKGQQQSPPQFSSPTSAHSHSNASEPASGMDVILEEEPVYLHKRYSSYEPKYYPQRIQPLESYRPSDAPSRPASRRRGHSVHQQPSNQGRETPSRRNSDPAQPSRREQFRVAFESDEAPRHIQLLEKGYHHFLDVIPATSDYYFSSMRSVISMALSMNKKLKDLSSQDALGPNAKASLDLVLQDCDDQIRSLTEHLLEASAPSVVSKAASPSSVHSSLRSSRSTVYRHAADIFPATPTSNASYSASRMSRPPTSPFPRHCEVQESPASPPMSTDSLPPERVYRHQPSASAHYYRGGMPIVDALPERRSFVEARRPGSAGFPPGAPPRKYHTLTSDHQRHHSNYHRPQQPYIARSDYSDRPPSLERPYQAYR